MGFWIFMFCCDLLIPLVMIFAGRMMQYHPPREINFVLGYRTARSMKNRETWVFAHRECGRLWQRWGWVELIATVVLMLLFLGEKTESVGIFGGILCLLQIVPLLVSIFVVEKKLQAAFDENGVHRR